MRMRLTGWILIVVMMAALCGAADAQDSADAVRAWLEPQGIQFPEFGSDVDANMGEIVGALVALPDGELAWWYPQVIAALKKELCDGEFYAEAVAAFLADERFSPALRSWVLPDYVDYLIRFTRNNTQFYGESDRAKAIIEDLVRAAHPDYAVDYRRLIEALEALDAPDIELIYPQLDRIVSLMDGNYGLLVDAYADSEFAQDGAPLYDQLMAERGAKLECGYWTPADLKLFYHVEFPDDGSARYQPGAPEAGAVLLICEDADADAAKALLSALTGDGLQKTGDPDRAQYVLTYQLTHGKGGEYSAAGLYIIAQNTTATLTFADWSPSPKEYARLSETQQPGDVISIPQGSVTYAAPAPDLRMSGDWDAFAGRVESAAK